MSDVGNTQLTQPMVAAVNQAMQIVYTKAQAGNGSQTSSYASALNTSATPRHEWPCNNTTGVLLVALKSGTQAGST